MSEKQHRRDAARADAAEAEADRAPVSVGRGLLAVSPIAVFLLVYLATSLVIGDFYKMPLSMALLVSSVWGAFTMSGRPLQERVDAFSRGAGSANVLYMIWIFILAGSFAAVAKEIGAVDAAVGLTLSVLPPGLVVPGLFAATCFVSMAIGSSVGTVVALTPLAVDMAGHTGAPVAFYVAIVLGGAFFGDNLSFISDTTIAATRTQGCDMRHKFLANIRIVLPAALIALALYTIAAPEAGVSDVSAAAPGWLVIPYAAVIVLALAGMNVTLVLLAGIATAFGAGLIRGYALIDLFQIAGGGIDQVGGLIVVTLLAAGMLGVIKATGGIDFILRIVGRNVGTSRGARCSILLLVGIVNLCTANNTVAIITVGSLTKRIAGRYSIAPREAASLLDTGSCVVQALIPYGAQTLMAASLADISPVAPWPYLFYPQMLIVCLAVAVLFAKKSRAAS